MIMVRPEEDQGPNLALCQKAELFPIRSPLWLILTGFGVSGSIDIDRNGSVATLSGKFQLSKLELNVLYCMMGWFTIAADME